MKRSSKRPKGAGPWKGEWFRAGKWLRAATSRDRTVSGRTERAAAEARAEAGR